MKTTHSIKVCSFTAIVLLTAAAAPVSAQPGINLGLSSGVTASLGLSSLGALGSVGSVPSLGSTGATASLGSSFASNAALSAPAGLDVVQQTIAEMTAETSSNGTMPTLPGLSDTPSSASLSGSVHSAVSGTLSGLEGLETGSQPSASIISEISGELTAALNESGDQAPADAIESSTEEVESETSEAQASTDTEGPSAEPAETDEVPQEDHFAELSGTFNSDTSVSMN